MLGGQASCTSSQQPSWTGAIHQRQARAVLDSQMYSVPYARSNSFPTRTAISLSLSGMSGDSHSTDYIDCGASSSSMMLMNEASRIPASVDIGVSTQTRDNAMLRYMEKKKNRR